VTEFVRGVAAGYGIAIPVGAIAVLIVLTAARESFQAGLAAGLGAASADVVYATVAVVAGAALSAPLAGVERTLHLVGGIVLVLIAALGLVRAFRARPSEAHDLELKPLATYARFLGLTLINPLTVVYFASIVLGNAAGLSSAEAVAFVAGVGLASASWQTLLATTGALAGRVLVDRWRLATSLVGYGIILVFAAVQLNAAAR
jgi:arginine exporter protein ArgO